MRNSITTIAGIFIFTITISSCVKLNLAKEAPNCIENKIREIQKEEVQNPPAEVWEWKADGKIYYYFNSACCDRFSKLYDDKCILLCAPDGGITGKGDGKCPEFTGEIEKTLIWKDERNKNE